MCLCAYAVYTEGIQTPSPNLSYVSPVSPASLFSHYPTPIPSFNPDEGEDEEEEEEEENDNEEEEDMEEDCE